MGTYVFLTLTIRSEKIRFSFNKINDGQRKYNNVLVKFLLVF